MPAVRAATIAGLGLAPRPLHLSAPEGAILFERLGPEWRPARIDDLAKPQTVEAVTRAFSHHAAGPSLGRRVCVFEGIARMRAILGEEADTLPPDAWWLLEGTSAIEAAFAAAGRDERPLHGDPHASNLLFDARETCASWISTWRATATRITSSALS